MLICSTKRVLKQAGKALDPGAEETEDGGAGVGAAAGVEVEPGASLERGRHERARDV